MLFHPILSAISASDLATIVAAFGGIIIGIFAARRGSKADKVTAETAEQNVILDGYGQIVKDLQVEIARIRKEYTDDLIAWKAEKDILLNQIKILQTEVTRADLLKPPPL